MSAGPSRLYFARRLTEKFGGAKIYLKREDLNHTGAHKINNTIGQALLTLRMGKKRVIAETGAGQHGVATATAAALFGLKCDVYMGAEDIRRQNLNVFRMKLMGANVIEVTSGSKTLKDATNEAMRDWMGSVEHTHYIIGSVVGPHPFPMIVRDFQSMIGREAREQCLRCGRQAAGLRRRLRRRRINAAGIFAPFADDASVKLIGVEAGGRGGALGQHAASPSSGKPGVLARLALATSCRMTTAKPPTCIPSAPASITPASAPSTPTGKTAAASNMSASPTTRRLKRSNFSPARRHPPRPGNRPRDRPSREARRRSCRRIKIIVVNLSGRGDKDCQEVARLIDTK